MRVMTVHAAKGLEFPVVAVADLGRGLGTGEPRRRRGHRPDRGADGDRDGRRRWAAAAGARFGMRLPIAGAGSLRLWELVELCEDERRADVEEACRLVYVAVSRAEDRLILSGIFRDIRPRSPRGAEGGALGAEAAAPGAPRAGLGRRRGTVELERRDGDRGRPPAGPAPRLAVRIQAPSAERAAELRRRMPWAGCERRRRRPLAPQAPLLERLEPRRRGGPASPTRPSPTYAGCRYRFYVERVIGLGGAHGRDEPADGSDDGERPQADELPAPAAGPRERSLAIGNAVHAPSSGARDAPGRRPASAELETILAREGLGGGRRGAERVEALVDGWLGSELRAELEASGGALRPEVPFVLGLGGAVVRGKIDLLAERPRVPWSSTTRPTRCGTPTRPSSRSATDAARPLRARRPRCAPKRGGDGRSRRLLLPRGARSEPSIEIYDAAGLAAARERLERLVAGIRAGDFDAHRRTPRRALLRLPGGGAALRQARLASRSGPRRRRARQPGMSDRLAVFAYGSLVSLASAERTLGRPVAERRPGAPGGLAAALVRGARQPALARRPSPAPTARLPPTASASTSSGGAGPGPNGALIEVTEEELDRLDRARDPLRPRSRSPPRSRPRSRRPSTAWSPSPPSRANYAETPPPGAVILASYAERGRGGVRVARRRASSSCSARRPTPARSRSSRASLVRDRIPAGNPREW